MTPALRFPPHIVVVPPGHPGSSDDVVSRPMMCSRGRVYSGIPWVAVAIGVAGNDWWLAPRSGPSQEELLAAIQYAHSTTLLLPYVWQVERERGLFRKTPYLLRGVVSAPMLQGLPPWLAGDLAVTLLLRRLAIVPAAGQLQTLSLLAAVRGRNELLVMAGEPHNPMLAHELWKYTGPSPPDCLIPNMVLHIDASLPEFHQITGVTRREHGGAFSYSNVSADLGSWLLGTEQEPPRRINIHLEAHQLDILRVLQIEVQSHLGLIQRGMTPSLRLDDRSLQAELENLERLGLAGIVKVDRGGLPWWALTKIGDGIVSGFRESGAVDSDEEELTKALRGEPIRFGAPAPTPYLKEDESRSGDMAVAILQKDASVAANVARTILFLKEGPHRDGLFDRVLSDPRPEVRAAALDVLAPEPIDKPAKATPKLTEARLVEVMRRGLGDSDARVRTPAARTAYATGKAAPVADLLIALLGRPPISANPTAPLPAGLPTTHPFVKGADTNANPMDPERACQYWSALALGCASDSASLSTLLRLRMAPDDAVAAASVLALGLRTDGRHAWMEALDSPRAPVRNAALSGLFRILTGLSDPEVDRLQSHPGPDVREGIRKYLLRRGRPK